MPLLQDLKPVAEALIARGGPVGVARAFGTRRDCVLAYHNVLPDGIGAGGDASLHLSRSRFREHLDQIQEDCSVVSLQELLRLPAPDTNPGRARVAITFDDAYRGALTEGVEEIASRGLPVTFFVSPGRLGDQTFWWDAIRRANGEPLRGIARNVAMEVYRGDQDAILHWANGCGLAVYEEHAMARSATEPEVESAASLPGVSLGAHGWSHRNLAALEVEELSSELGRSLRWLRTRQDQGDAVLSYPYGRSAERVGAETERQGFGAGLLVGGGALDRERRRRFAVPRINVPAALTANGLRLRLSGLVTGDLIPSPSGILA